MDADPNKAGVLRQSPQTISLAGAKTEVFYERGSFLEPK